MEFLNILEYPDPRLRVKAKSVTPENIYELISFVKDLVYTMYKADGIGLAATQVGVNKRIIVLDISRKCDRDKDKFVLLESGDILQGNKNLIIAINPDIVSKEDKITYEEGCLSIPKFNADIERARVVKVKALNLAGEEFFIEAEDLLAVALQHEIDHLNGVLFIDKVSPLKRSLYNASLNKLKSKKTEKDLD